MPLILKSDLVEQFQLWYRIKATVSCNASDPEVIETFSGPKLIEDIGTKYFPSFKEARDYIASINQKSNQALSDARDELTKLSNDPSYKVDHSKLYGFNVKQPTKKEWLLDKLGINTEWRRKLDQVMQDAYEFRNAFSARVNLVELPNEVAVPNMLPIGTKVWYSTVGASGEKGFNFLAQEVEIALIELQDNRRFNRQGNYDFIPKYVLSNDVSFSIAEEYPWEHDGAISTHIFGHEVYLNKERLLESLCIIRDRLDRQIEKIKES